MRYFLCSYLLMKSPFLPAPLPTLWAAPSMPLPTPPEPPAPVRVGTPQAAWLNPVRVWGALSLPLRWRLVLRMAAGEEITATIAARGAKLRLGSVRKNLAVLKKAGVVASRAGIDRRSEVFFIPPERRPEPGVLDFGCCRITLHSEAM